MCTIAKLESIITSRPMCHVETFGTWHCHGMQAGIQLTPEQKRALLQSRNRLLARMISILQRRSKVHSLSP